MKDEIAVTRIHLIGIGGSGMLPLAIILKQDGYVVSGEDDKLCHKARDILDRHEIDISSLRSLQSSDSIKTVVRSSAIGDQHPSVIEATKRGCRILARGEQLAEFVNDKRVIAIAGSHGKTSTCGVLVDLLESLGVYPCYLIGGLFSDAKDPGRWNESEWAVIEIDESDGTIEAFAPDVTIILNVDHDHHAYYSRYEDYLASFQRLLSRTKYKTVLTGELRELLGSKVDAKKIVWADEGNLPEIESDQIGAYSRQNQRAALAALAALEFPFPGSFRMEFTPRDRRQAMLYVSTEVRGFED
ncbi:MAG: Mur ligase domain-containing protein, partial [Opitutales bacterium]|nr:Mur ligase domain-containing protein [Opitutales bacterium]